MRLACCFRSGNQEIPPRVNEDQHTVQTQIQTIPSTRLLVADPPEFYFSFEFFFYLFHGTIPYLILITNNLFDCHHLLGLIPPFGLWGTSDFPISLKKSLQFVYIDKRKGFSFLSLFSDTHFIQSQPCPVSFGRIAPVVSFLQCTAL